MRVPYVYWIKNKTTGLKYIGAKYAKNADPDLFWKTYFTSSIHVKKLIEMYGKDDFIFKILKICVDEYQALAYENRLNRLAVRRQDYLNLHYNFIGDNSEEEYFDLKEKQQKIARIYGNLSVLRKTGLFRFTEEEKKLICSEGGKAAGKINKQLGRAIFDPAVRERQHNTLMAQQKSAFYDPILKKRISSMGGKNGGFSKVYYEKMGVSEQERIDAQRARGKKGGPKNKGFRWYNDGEKNYKYSVKKQKIKNFEDFLVDEGKYIAGKIPNNVNKIWVNNGIKNMMVGVDDYNPAIHSKGRLGNKGKYNGHKNKKNHAN